MTIDVHVTNGLTWLDWVVAATTVLAALVSLAAIVIAYRARTDLVADRRTVFELGLLLWIYDRYDASPQPPQFRSYLNLLPDGEFPALHERVHTQYPWDQSNSAEEFDKIKEKMKIELEAGIAKRTR